MPPNINRDLCTDCAVCYDLCPGDCFGLDSAAQVVVKDRDRCWHCGCCERECPAEAIKVGLPFVIRVG
ncbi:MAG: ferredoxin family protein [Chloroflexi bacterium]|nr:ferredoxin family protein [Chloroflexota bacterium]